MVETLRPPDQRKERARATRRRMVEAAYRQFCDRGYGVPLTAVAAAAGVAVQTIYFTFHTKAALLEEALALAVLGDDLPIPPHERAWFAQMRAEPDPRRALELILLNTQVIQERVAPLAAVFKNGDPEVAAMWRHSEEMRFDGMAAMVRVLADKGQLRPGLDLRAASDIVFVLLGPDTYQAFVDGLGWEPRQWQERMSGVLADALFEPAPGQSGPTG